MKTLPLTVIIPTYNEVNNIEPLITRINGAIHPQEILVVDDRSPDGTADRVIQCRKHISNVRCITNTHRLGLTGSIRKGLNQTHSTYVAWMDGDLSHPPELLTDMFRLAKTNDIVVASWLTGNGRDARKPCLQTICSNCINTVCQVLFGNHIHAYTSGYIMTTSAIMKAFPLRGEYGEYCIDFLVRATRRDLHITEIPFTCVPRFSGQTKTSPDLITFIRKGYGYIRTITGLFHIR